MEKIFLILLLPLLFIITVGCGDVSTEDTVIKDYIAEKQEPQGERLLNKEEIKSIFKEAHKITLDIFSQGFHAEYEGRVKVPFSEFQSDLQEHWSLEIVNNLEKFYNNHLWDWGFEMPRAFPLAFMENHQLAEVNYEDERIEVTFLIDQGYDKDGFKKGLIKEKYVLVKINDKWVVGL